MIAGQMQIPDGDDYFRRVFSRSGDRFQDDLFRAALGYTDERCCAVDVGAHVGAWTRQMAAHFTAVWAFEPSAENYACLQHNTNGLSNVLRLNVALGKEKGRCSMAKHGTNSGCWNATPGEDVQVSRLDDFDVRIVDLLKIDVEGFEGEVLLGAELTITALQPVIVFEDNGLGLKLYGSKWIDPKVVLNVFGYRFCQRIGKDEIWTCESR